MLVETHCHCQEYSPDSNRPLMQLLREAAQLGFASVTLTDHFDKDYCSRGSMVMNANPFDEPIMPGEWIFDLNEYHEFIYSAQKQVPCGLQLLHGVEVGYRADIENALANHFKDEPFDQVIGSIHAVDGKDLSFSTHPLYQLEKVEAYDYVLESHLHMLKSSLDFHVLAHIDYITRYVPYADKVMRYQEHASKFDAIFREMIERDIALEINTRTRYKEIDRLQKDRGPMDSDILRRYHAMGGRLLTLASDSHEDGSIGRCFADTRRWLRYLGFSKGCYFIKGKPKLYDL